MLLIFGFRTRGSTTATQSFHCPRCGVDRMGDLKAYRRWFTLFFLPVIPLGKAGASGTAVQCQTCKGRFTPAVLTTPTTDDLSRTLVDARRLVVIAILRSAGAVSASMQQAAVRAMAAATGDLAGEEQRIANDVAVLDVSPIWQRVGTLGPALNEAGRERFLADAAAVALVDGGASPATQEILDGVAGSLGMTQAHARGVLDAARESSTWD